MGVSCFKGLATAFKEKSYAPMQAAKFAAYQAATAYSAWEFGKQSVKNAASLVQDCWNNFDYLAYTFHAMYLGKDARDLISDLQSKQQDLDLQITFNKQDAQVLEEDRVILDNLGSKLGKQIAYNKELGNKLEQDRQDIQDYIATRQRRYRQNNGAVNLALHEKNLDPSNIHDAMTIIKGGDRDRFDCDLFRTNPHQELQELQNILNTDVRVERGINESLSDEAFAKIDPAFDTVKNYINENHGIGELAKHCPVPEPEQTSYFWSLFSSQ